MAYIYHMAHQADWFAAQKTGVYAGSPDDLRDGFIHFSDSAQIKHSAAKHRKGQKDLLLIKVRSDVLGNSLQWEKSRDGELFPHLYTVLETRLVCSVKPLPLGLDGEHVFPEFEEMPNAK